MKTFLTIAAALFISASAVKLEAKDITADDQDKDPDTPAF